MATSRFPNGVTNAVKATTLNALGTMDPTKMHTYWNDFDSYTAGDWVVTTTGSGTAAVTAGDGGLAILTNGASDNDNIFLQKTPAAFLLDSTKKSWFKARFKVSDATQSDVAIGLQVVDTTPLDVTDGIYFLKVDDAATYDIICRKDATTGSLSGAAIGSLADNTYAVLGWYYNGAGSLEYYINDVKIGTLSVASYFPDTSVTPSIGIQNGAAASKTLTIDYFYCAQER